MNRPDHARVTIARIAAELQCDPSTVSAVLAGKSAARRISAATSAAVLAKAAELNYVPNALARGLRRRRTEVLGVVFSSFGQGWAQRVLQGVEAVLRPAGYVAFSVTHNWSPENEARLFDALVAQRVDGILCIPIPGGLEHYARIRRLGLPLIFLADALAETPEAHYVVWDSGTAAQLAVQQLIGIGRRRIAFVGARHGTLMTRLRYEGYCAALRQAALEPAHVIWHEVGHSGRGELKRAVERMFAEPAEAPDAVFCLNDNLALSVQVALGELGVGVPDDVALMGMGDYPECAHPGIGLSSMREPCERIGELAGRRMLELIAGETCGPIQERIVCNDLRLRATTGFVACAT